MSLKGESALKRQRSGVYVSRRYSPTSRQGARGDASLSLTAPPCGICVEAVDEGCFSSTEGAGVRASPWGITWWKDGEVPESFLAGETFYRYLKDVEDMGNEISKWICSTTTRTKSLGVCIWSLSDYSRERSEVRHHNGHGPGNPFPKVYVTFHCREKIHAYEYNMYSEGKWPRIF